METSLATRREEPSICDRVRESCFQWMETNGSEYIQIHSDALISLAQKIQKEQGVSWDEENWHYQPPLHWPEHIRKERSALYILALDALNFCFWPSTENYQYSDLACTLTSVASADHEQVHERLNANKYEEEETNFVSRPDADSFLLSPRLLRDISEKEMINLFAAHHKTRMVPPDMDRRCELWNELGRVLCDRYQGSAMPLVHSANGSAVRLVQIIFDNFLGFRDCVDEKWFFLKRAQICVGDLRAALSLNFPDMDQLTCFADYRLPQLLRHWGVLEYIHQEFRLAVDNLQELPSGSDAEISIRAATVVTVHLLVQELQKMENSFPKKKWIDIHVDWYLWQVGERLDSAGQLRPFHRVRTIFY